MASESSRARGALLAAAYGDALGWPIEDRGNRVGGISRVPARLELVDWTRREGGPWASHEMVMLAGEYSDDTQLLLAASRSLDHGVRWLDHFRQTELPLWTVYQRGGGGATKRSAQAWFQGRAPWQATNPKARRNYFSAGGNGTAMRCLPYAIWAENASELIHFVDQDGISTHGHPRALVGARAYAWAAFWALRRSAPLDYGELLERVLAASSEWAPTPSFESEWQSAAHESGADFERTWTHTVEEMIDLLQIAQAGIAQGAIAIDNPVLDEIGTFGRSRGAGTVTAAGALFLATRYSTQPEQGILASAFAKGGDTDTLASMTGGLLGALRGDDWLSKHTDRLQDRSYIERQSVGIANRDTGSNALIRFAHRDRRDLYRWLDEADEGSTFELGPFGMATLSSTIDHQCRSQFVRSWRLDTEIGQTLVLTRADKGSQDGRPRWAKVSNPSGPSSEAQPPAPRAGIVIPVFDLDESAAFYERVLGLTIQRRHPRWVSFGWLALEVDRHRSQRRIAPEPELSAMSIRLYMTRERLSLVRSELARLGIPTVLRDAPADGSFCSVDLDGHPIECLSVDKGTEPLVTQRP